MKGRWKRVWSVLWPLLSGVSLRIKIMGIALISIFSLGLGITGQARAMMVHSLQRELEQRGISIARDLAFRSTDLILTNHLYGLYTLARETVQTDEDVRYTFLVDPAGNVLAHSFENGFPAGLLSVNRPEEGQPYRLQRIQTEEGLILDVAVPVFDGRAGTARVGMSYRRLDGVVAGATRWLLVTMLAVSLVGIGLSSLLTWLLTRPVQALTEATRRVGEGDLSPRLMPWAKDEIGYLQESFNTMVERLARARQEMAAVNESLLRRNRELSTLYGVSQVLSGPLELEAALQDVLQQTVTAVEARGGWVCLVTADHSDCRTCAAFWRDGAPRFLLDRCPHCTACERVRANPHPAILVPASSECPACPLLQEKGANDPIEFIGN